MTCPFPGMDPYIEASGSWGDFHSSIITFLRVDLNRLIRPRYAAVTQERFVVVENERGIWPDVTLLGLTPERNRRDGAILEADPAIILEAGRPLELMRQPFLHIVDPNERGKVITIVEVISPSNKEGKGLAAHRAKLDECWEAGVNVVEIDLLKAGESILREEFARKLPLGDSPYVVAVSRCVPPRCEVYRVQLRDRLPRIAIPLTHNDADVVVDLQSAFEKTWESGPSPNFLPYDEPLPGHWSDDDRAWCQEQIAKAGLAGS